MIGNAMENSCRHGNPAAHGPIDGRTIAAPRRIEIIEPLAGERAVGIDHGGRLAHDAIPRLPAAHSLADRLDYSAELMPEHDGIVHRPTMRRFPHVQVAAADAHGRDLK